MRINLVTPLAEKDAVKALGARWDAATELPQTASQLLAQSTAQESVTAELANEPDAKAQNRAQIAALSDCADGPQQAEHIRGMVAATVAQISVHANSITRENAARWQTWALGLADGLEQSALAASPL